MQREHDPNEPQAPRERSGQALRDQVEANDWKWLMSSKQGRRLAWSLLEIAGLYRSSFTGNSETFFNEGKRDVGLRLLKKIETAGPEAYVLMLTESKAKA